MSADMTGPKKYMVDGERLGEVVDTDPNGCVWLRPPGGGAEWSPMDPSRLREPDADELSRAQILGAPLIEAQP
ncbi:hypothetical protein [Streptomyces bacillaris]|uniref:hypothetical protein n=1 Tax=Streptomyces bacillaris TaxID=68179 RepID=UPI00382B885A